jgi:hypothetical protein
MPSSLICQEINLLKGYICREIEFMKMNKSSLFLGFSWDKILILRNIYVCVGPVKNYT